MANIPGLDAEVYFTDPAKPLRNWREHVKESDGDDIDDAVPLTGQEHESLVGMLGFDPDEDEPETVAKPIRSRGKLSQVGKRKIKCVCKSGTKCHC